ncbi:MAG: sugar MFS transporter [Cyclobacteriaceae bacterium]|nr:sugar MFS transporter [Cyclobacteriaceae bacterium]
MIKKNNTAFGLLVSLFFMWGFLTELDGALIPYLKDVFTLSDFAATLVQFAFFIAFVTMSMPSAWLLNKIGYSKGVVVGLAIMGLGSFLFFPASKALSYPVFLSAIFVLAIGVTVLQVAANPYVTLLGEPAKASSRLNLAQGINSLAKVLAPFFGSYFILRGLEQLTSDEEKAQAVQLPYIILGSILLLLAIVFWFIKLPDVAPEKENTESDTNSMAGKTSAWQFPQLSRGAVAIFFYVGVEVAVGTFLVLFLTQQDIAGLSKEDAALYLPFYWGGLMVGRLGGSYILNYIKPNVLLAVFAVGAAICIILVVLGTGEMAMWALIATGLFHSIMWSNIFALSIDGLGKFTSQGSGILVAAIVGGALIPPLQGLISDNFGRQNSFLVLLIGYVYIFYYGWKGYQHSKSVKNKT